MSEFEYIENGMERIVHSYWDSDKWVFYASGQPLPFENLQYYKRRNKKERINYDIIDEYLQANGCFFMTKIFGSPTQQRILLKNTQIKGNALYIPQAFYDKASEYSDVLRDRFGCPKQRKKPFNYLLIPIGIPNQT